MFTKYKVRWVNPKSNTRVNRAQPFALVLLEWQPHLELLERLIHLLNLSKNLNMTEWSIETKVAQSVGFSSEKIVSVVN